MPFIHSHALPQGVCAGQPIRLFTRALRHRSFPALTLWLFFLTASAFAQSPFVTDDAEVAQYRRWHFEFADEFDYLPVASLPNLHQNTAGFKTSYGLLPGLEVGLDNQLLNIRNAPNPVLPRRVFGYGDIDLSAKWNFFRPPDGSRLPALAASINVEVPTGDARRQLGTGLSDVFLNGILQKKWKTTRLQANGGYFFAGNTATGATGVRTLRGHLFTGGASLLHDFSRRLDLGAEIFGVAGSNFDLGLGQLQIEFGGNFNLRQNLSLDFGVIRGFDLGSPKVAPVIGFSIDF